MKWIQQKKALYLPVLHIKTKLSCILECVKLTTQGKIQNVVWWLNWITVNTQSNIPSESLSVFVTSMCRNGSKLFVFISILNSQYTCILFRCCKSTHNSTTPCSKRKNCISTYVTLGDLRSLPVQNSPLSEPNFLQLMQTVILHLCHPSDCTVFLWT